MVRIAILLFAWSMQVALAEVNVTAELSDTRIQIAESVKLMIGVVSEGGNVTSGTPTFEAPDFDVANQYSSLSSSQSYVNGKFSSTVTRIYTFVLFPKQAGDLKITDIK